MKLKLLAIKQKVLKHQEKEVLDEKNYISRNKFKFKSKQHSNEYFGTDIYWYAIFIISQLLSIMLLMIFGTILIYKTFKKERKNE